MKGGDTIDSNENGRFLPVSRFLLHLVPLSPIALSPNKGSTIRGGFGNALKDVICTRPTIPTCPDCPLHRTCAYPYLFETPLPVGSSRMSKGEAIPRPFVMDPPLGEKLVYHPGEVLTVGLALIGKAVDLLPHFILAFEELGRRGIGRGRGTFKIEDTQPVLLHEELPAACRRLTLRFLTPTRIVADGRPSDDLDFALFFRTLHRRIENLRVFHGTSERGIATDDLRRRAEEITVVRRGLRWADQERYSRRQGQTMPQGGFVGEIVFEGDLTPFVPYVRLGEAVHVGKGATFGMGRYEIDETKIGNETGIEAED